MKRLFILGFAVVFLFSACSKKGKGSIAEKAKEESKGVSFKVEEKEGIVILEIGSKRYSLSDFEDYLAVKNLKLEELDDYTKSRIFDNYVENRLLIAEAERNEVFITSNELASYRKRLEQMGVSLNERLIKAIYDDLLVKKYLALLGKDLQIKDSEALAYYREHIDQFRIPEEVKVRQIVVSSEEEAIKILEKLKKSPPSAFERIAREKSEGPEAERGGLMGYFRKGDLPMEMEEVIFNLSVGQISQVVKTAYGYHIFRVEEKRPPRTLPFSAVKDRIKAKIFEEKMKKKVKDRLDQLKQTLGLKIYYENLPFKYKKEESFEESSS